ncbi:hypothetical protein D3C84_938150 [compost metagenome]
MTYYTNPHATIGSLVRGAHVLACIREGVVVPAMILKDGSLSGISAIPPDENFAVICHENKVSFVLVGGCRLVVFTEQRPHLVSYDLSEEIQRAIVEKWEDSGIGG